jgi:3-oxoacyl-[acyl-carrier protein] reductase
MCARGKEALAEAASAVREKSEGEVLDIPADVSRPEDVTRLVRATMERFGRVDILVTNAGGPPSGPFESLTPEKWNDAIQLTLLSTVNLCRAVLPGMKQRKWGRIINVTSIAVKQPVDGLMLSNSLRAGVTGFARTLANEVARDGITVNNILPGYTRTERVESLARAAAQRDRIPVQESLQRWENEIPMRRLGEPREFAALAAFLASERASYITGTSITVDGGWTRGLL